MVKTRQKSLQETCFTFFFYDKLHHHIPKIKLKHSNPHLYLKARAAKAFLKFIFPRSH